MLRPMQPSLDPRLHAYRPDLADIRLKGTVESARFVEGMPRRVVAAAAPIKRVPRSDAGLESEALRGESFMVFEDGAEGWSWGQLETDSYVGYVPTDALSTSAPEPSHRVAALRTFLYPGPDLKLPASACLSLGSRLALTEAVTTRGTTYRLLAGGEGAVAEAHVVPLDAPPEGDFVTVAERFLGAPYLWGGRTSIGLDCSGLVQLSLMAAGHNAPRDTDLQQTMLGHPAEGGAAALHRGDLVFWAGHVGIMIDGEYMIHASGHHMAVVIEPLADAVARIGAVANVRRLSR
jgi:cell wall-associated NlpC family hydrolase